ncbi:MAG TPA: beta-galactosidase trimerization domain-containing protein, partial [Terracidiphilus sp.]|nr:beta-galactosidase trimerization domain-containing protein [Terracidiphilus sp.]
GGHLLLGPRSGMKDEHNSLNPQRQPGPLVDALGGRVEQFYALDAPVPLSGTLGAGTAALWAEQLSTRDDGDEVLLRYGKSNGWLDGQAAVISRRLGKGRITYLGAVLDPDLMRRVVQWATDGAQLKAEFGPTPESVEVCRRVGKDRTVFILINHGGRPTNVTLPGAMRDVLREGRSVDSVALGPQAVSVLEENTR